ncbi:hypothetical protein BLNAU_19917 [Blattamonas nauphoetae]|uniref:Uncharacterized protein n=1 Tax=Blattamonas nauphoetae TaxID=2049346 RepID=A0ABQ9X0T0_9EUKA|nr:hypothetical protein BLNAU_19917 [Blattamonas nauphoetae]
MQYSPTNQKIPPLSPTNHPAKSVRLTFRFIPSPLPAILLCCQLSLSNCLPTQIEHHSRDNLIPSVFHRLVSHLVSTGTLTHICDPSDAEALVIATTVLTKQSLPADINLSDTLMRLVRCLYVAIHLLEDEECDDPAVRLTDFEGDCQSPQFTRFARLLEPELEYISKQFNSDLFEEAKRVSLWNELLQKVSDGEEVLFDKSFLKSPIFRPSLLSLQAKFQHLASSGDGSEDISTSSLHSSHSTPHTSLQAHLDSSLRTHSSSSAHFKQESLELLTILHSLLSSPLPPSLPFSLTDHSPTDNIGSLLTSPLPPSHPKQINPDRSGQILTLSRLDDLNPTERFNSSLFDEDNDAILTQSLNRCDTVCDLVGAENCILDISAFLDRTVSALGSSDNHLREAAYSLFLTLVEVPSTFYQLPHLWDRLRTAFRDGWPQEQFAMLKITTKWTSATTNDMSLPPFTWDLFDWDGLFSADLSWMALFLVSIDLIMSLRRPSIEDEIGKAKATQLFLAFERHHQAVSRISSEFTDYVLTRISDDSILVLVSYSLLMALVFKSEFPATLTSFLAAHPEIDVHSLPLSLVNQLTVLCHTSLNRHKPHQPPLDLIFERLLRTSPVDLIVLRSVPDFDLPPVVMNNSLCGFHALCRRGVHIDLFESAFVQSGRHLPTTFLMFFTPLISHTFLLFHYYPPPLVVRFLLPILSSELHVDLMVDSLKELMTSLLIVTAPFGDCHSLKELFRSVRHKNNNDDHTSTDDDDPTGFESLEWLSIPTGFGSALAHSDKHVPFDAFNNQDKQHVSTKQTPTFSHLASLIPEFLSAEARNVNDGILLAASFVHMLNPIFTPWLVFENDRLVFLCTSILSPIPAEVSVMLEFVKRLVWMSSAGFRVKTVHIGLVDCVIRAVSESSFLEDYENGICVIGILLGSIRDSGNKKDVVVHDFSPLLSRP